MRWGIIGESMREEGSKERKDSVLMIAWTEQRWCPDMGSVPTTHIWTSLPHVPMFALAALFKAQHVTLLFSPVGALYRANGNQGDGLPGPLFYI